MCFAEYHLLQFVFVSLRSKFAVLSNPVPDRQPCSVLCRVSSLGPLVQTEVMAGFPVKVSDWTVIYFYSERRGTRGTAIELSMMSNLFRESLLE